MQCHRNTNCIPETATQILPGLLSPIVTAIQRLPARISQSNTNCHPKTVTQRLSPKDCHPRTATPKTASTDCLSIPIRKVIFVTNNIGFLVLPLKTLNNIGFLAFLLKAFGLHTQVVQYQLCKLPPTNCKSGQVALWLLI